MAAAPKIPAHSAAPTPAACPRVPRSMTTCPWGNRDRARLRQPRPLPPATSTCLPRNSRIGSARRNGLPSAKRFASWTIERRSCRRFCSSESKSRARPWCCGNRRRPRWSWPRSWARLRSKRKKPNAGPVKR
uniref:(northern house mosquito) hypothetical protein n=1 Tax=Culex pipiens TaxID=7175 RepID=A0A8D8EYW6_CULPI